MSVKNKYQIERKYVTNSKARSRQKINKVRFLVAHETANNSTGADGHQKYFQNITFAASAHAFIDDKKILEIIPLDEKAWHVQYNQDRRTLGLGYANDNAIGPELCRPGDFAKAYDRYAWYFAYLCKEFGLKPKQHITAHKFEDPQRRSDPQSWLEPNGLTWNQFINDVQAYYNAWEGEAKVEAKPDKPASPSKSKPSSVKKGDNLVVDGYWGRDTTRALQKALGTVVDGEIWGQVRNAVTKQITGGVKYGKGGSPMVKKLQQKVNSKADGIIGANTISALQNFLNTPRDGELWKPSTMVKELQRRLNAGTF